MANCSQMVRVGTMVTMESHRKLPLLFLMVPSLTPYNLPFPQNECRKCTSQNQLVVVVVVELPRLQIALALAGSRPIRRRKAMISAGSTRTCGVSGPREVRHAPRSPGSSREVRSSVLETISTLTSKTNFAMRAATWGKYDKFLLHMTL